MATRTIVTSQPDVACDVCERRLLRGENHDVFLAAGRRRTVCELCAPRAVHQGWMRESEQPEVSLPPTRPRRGRSLLTRLRQRRDDVAPDERSREQRPAEDFALSEPGGLDGAGALEEGAYDAPSRPRRPVAARPFDRITASAEAPGFGGAEVGDTGAGAHAEAAPADPVLETALAIFNSSEHPRRVAGVARSLGAPAVSVRSAEHARSVVRIVVAWELCWYRYQVDLDELDAACEVIAQGTELSELAGSEREANARADSAGLLSLA